MGGVQARPLSPVQGQPLAPSSRMAASPAPVQSHAAPPVRTASAQPVSQPKFRLVEPKAAAAEPVSRVEAPAPVRPVKAEPARPEIAAPAKPAPAPVQVAAVKIEPQPVEPVPPAQPMAPAAEPEAAKAPVSEPEQTASLSMGDFRWPVRGRVIAGFGANGGNEGINIAVPEGTPVKATEAGTVTYAGDEVKGYGKLILVRHENGYVSAYAHNSALKVKRGDQVKRGQVIATSGQTGNVTSPQLHFEIRKGATPVDPLKHLGG